jgi:replicative DNA helicase Mcm
MVYSSEDLYESLEEFFYDYGYIDIIERVADRYPDEKSVIVSWSDIDRYDSELADYLIEHPYDVISRAEETIKRLIPPQDRTIGRIHFRCINIPPDTKIEVRHLRGKHVGHFISVDGLVRRATEVRPRIVDAMFECQRCRRVIKEKQEDIHLKEPIECYKDQGGCGKPRAATYFKPLTEVSELVDSQKIEIQERPEKLRGGEQPQRLSGWLDDDLTGEISVGDRVVLNGILRTFLKGDRRKSTQLEIFLDINSIEVDKGKGVEEITPEEEEEILRISKKPDIHQKIIASIAPTIYGMHIEKEAIALQLFGGVQKKMLDKSEIRGDIHILLVGDPGTAKSQLLRYVSNLAPRGMYAVGKTTSAAGLTAAAVRDVPFGEGRWVLEAGTLVLADKGIACIDELDKMSPQDRSGMHEAMEQQTVTVAKAGIAATLMARCAILGAANPEFGRFDRTKPIVDQIMLPPTLLSRFDVILVVRDIPDEKDDELMAEHILRAHIIGEKIEASLSEDVEDDEYKKCIEPKLDPDFLRKYIAYAKDKIKPVMTEKAYRMIKDYYTKIRKLGEGEGAPVPITARQLEAIVRLSEASARLRLSNKVTDEDALRAIRLIEYSLRKVASDSEGLLDIDILTTGKSRSHWEVVKIVKSIIRTLIEEEETADHDKIVEIAESQGIKRSRTETILHRMHAEGEIFEPRYGKRKYKLTM